jgi:hypothetical protein
VKYNEYVVKRLMAVVANKTVQIRQGIQKHSANLLDMIEIAGWEERNETE